MKKFLAVYLSADGAMTKWMSMDKEQRSQLEKKGIDTWSKWVEKNFDSIIDTGTPLGKTKRIAKNGISDTKNNLTAYTIVEAESHEAAAKMFLEHPHFTIFPGESIEIMECLPLPSMD